MRFRTPTADSRQIVAAAIRGLESQWREGFAWKKAGVILLDLVRPEDVPRDLFAPDEPDAGKPKALMAAVDAVNGRMGKGSVSFGLTEPGQGWETRCSNRSPSWTTRWDEIPVVKA
jgi:DNA polymerase V